MEPDFSIVGFNEFTAADAIAPAAIGADAPPVATIEPIAPAIDKAPFIMFVQSELVVGIAHEHWPTNEYSIDSPHLTYAQQAPDSKSMRYFT